MFVHGMEGGTTLSFALGSKKIWASLVETGSHLLGVLLPWISCTEQRVGADGLQGLLQLYGSVKSTGHNSSFLSWFLLAEHLYAVAFFAQIALQGHPR